MILWCLNYFKITVIIFVLLLYGCALGEFDCKVLRVHSISGDAIAAHSFPPFGILLKA